MAARSGELTLSVIVPALNEAGGILNALEPLQALRGGTLEVILVDGGSTDETVERAAPLVDRLLRTTPGRAHQMNAGAELARGSMLWFLHADSVPGRHHPRQLLETGPGGWGRFDIRLSGGRRCFRLIETLINLRSRLTGIATGDQGIFVERGLFLRAGGFPDQPLMEDIALSATLKRLDGRPRCLRPALVTDSRRWERRGAWRTIIQMWCLRWRYWRGESPETLHRIYYAGDGS